MNWYQYESFHPTWRSVFINPYFFARKALKKGIKRHANQLNGILLDFGCGCKPYRELFQVDRYIGVDISDSGHNHTGEDIDHFYDGNKIPFEDETFDSVLSSEVFEHVFNLDEVLAEINRVMKKGGKLLITVPFTYEEHEAPYDFGRYSAYGIRHLLVKHGFEVLTIDKSMNTVETLIQLWIVYMEKSYPSNRTLRRLLTVLLSSLINPIGLLLSAALPKRHDLYMDNIVLAQKIGTNGR